MIVPRSWGGKTQPASSSHHISDALAVIFPGGAITFHVQGKERGSRAEIPVIPVLPEHSQKINESGPLLKKIYTLQIL